ncbi:MAG: TIGR02117 family protein [Bacteroidota bacterium]
MAWKNRKLKVGFKILKNVLAALVGLIVLYLAIALLLSFLPTHPPEKNCRPEHKIFVATNGVHLDIILPVEKIETDLRSQLQLPAGTRFVSFGWGDKAFYIKTPEWSDLTFPVAFRALFLKTEAAMHVTSLGRMFSDWKEVEICTGQLNTLNSYINSSFKKNETGELQKLEFPGYTSHDDFYEGNGSFTVFRTCNVWANNALKETGVKTSVWSPFDFGVLHHLP